MPIGRFQLAHRDHRTLLDYQERGAMNHHRWTTWLIVGIWVLFCLATLNYNGPFFDEAIYVTAGLRTFEGHGFSDGYLGWFTGLHLIWPVLAATGYKIAGLMGTRTVAVILATVGFIAIVQAAKNLFGQKAGFPC